MSFYRVLDFLGHVVLSKKVIVGYRDLSPSMAEHNDTDSECVNGLSSWENGCIQEYELEKESMFDERLQAENERTSQKMWTSFQNSATAVSHLFKGVFINC